MHRNIETPPYEVIMRVFKTSLLISLLAGMAGIVVFASACHRRTVAESHPIPATAPSTVPPPAVPACSLTAEPASVGQGQSATLTWTSSNATDLDLEPGLGKQQATGSTTVTPQDSTEYTLTAMGPSGTTTCGARVTVVTPPTPAPPPTAQVSEQDLFTEGMKDAFFDLDKSDLRPDAQEALRTDAAFLKAHPAKVQIEGNCDSRGSEEYNLGLGERRAEAARDFLVNLGISADSIKTISYGKDRPLCTEQTEECWQRNRRAHPNLATPTP
jgi:peptidoglycan-associated lipoprotein